MPVNNSANSYGSFIGGSFLLVDPESEYAADDTNRGTPFLTLTGVNTVATATDTVFIASGNYTAPVTSFNANSIVGLGRSYITGTLKFARSTTTSLNIEGLDLATGTLEVEFTSNSGGLELDLNIQNCVGSGTFVYTEAGSQSYKLTAFFANCDFSAGFTFTPSLPNSGSDSSLFITCSKFNAPSVTLATNNIKLTGCEFNGSLANISNASFYTTSFTTTPSIVNNYFYDCRFANGCVIESNTLTTFSGCFFDGSIRSSAGSTCAIRLIGCEIQVNSGSFCIYRISGGTFNVSKASTSLTGSVTATDVSSLTTLTAL